MTFKIVRNNTARQASHGKVNFIPKAINLKADRLTKENRQLMQIGIDPSLFRNELGELKKPISQILSEKTEYDDLL